MWPQYLLIDPNQEERALYEAQEKEGDLYSGQTSCS